MKILYGIMGTGEGHITRARALAPELWKQGVQVDFVVAGRPKGQTYFGMEFFGSNITYYNGLSLAIEKGNVDWLATLKRMHRDLPAYTRAVYEIVQKIRQESYDLILTDFEPATAFAGCIAKLPVLGISRQFAVLNTNLPNSDAMARCVYQAIVPTTVSLGFYFHPFGSETILPPMAPPPQTLEHEADDRPTTLPTSCLVYLPFEDLTEIEAMLLPIRSSHFVVYHKDVSVTRLQKTGDGSVSYRPFSRSSFRQTLLESESVICNAGFGLLSESIQLGKRILVKPVVGQSEQESNATTIQLLGLGQLLGSLETRHVREWLDNEATSASSHVVIPNVAAELAEWIVGGTLDEPQKLTRQLWGKVYPQPRSTSDLSVRRSWYDVLLPWDRVALAVWWSFSYGVRLSVILPGIVILGSCVLTFVNGVQAFVRCFACGSINLPVLDRAVCCKTN